MRFVEALGMFGFVGAVGGVIWYGVFWIAYFCIFFLIPSFLNHFSPENMTLASKNFYEAKEVLDAIYGFSWFSGVGILWKVLFPSELDKVLEPIYNEMNKLTSRSMSSQLRRAYFIFVIPWWLFVGHATLKAYYRDGYVFINNILGNVADGKNTLFLLACVTLMVPLCGSAFLKIWHWIRTGEGS